MSTLLSKEDSDLLDYTIDIRKKIISELVKNGYNINGRNEQELLSRTLDGLDGTLIKRAKLKLEEQSLIDNKQTQALITELLTQVIPRKFATDTVLTREIPQLPDMNVTINDSEKYQGIENIEYEDIVK